MFAKYVFDQANGTIRIYHIQTEASGETTSFTYQVNGTELGQIVMNS